ncbi:hypothetical protein C8Q75DRAFT_806638 [Abortiporus biennis]|nr:hypothetical protein C8Q75DRAFT_806638 [Abortiporus biennis]
MFDGCPIVRLSDSKKEIRYLLQIFYDGSVDAFSASSKALDFLAVSIMLRLGSKYGIDFIRNEAIVRLEKCFPSTFEEYDKLRRSQYYDAEEKTGIVIKHPILLTKVDAFDVLELARQFDLRSIMKAAWYLAAQNPLEKLADYLEKKRINHTDFTACILGQESLVRANFHGYSEIIYLYQRFRVGYVDPSDKCLELLLNAWHDTSLSFSLSSHDPLSTPEEYSLEAHLDDAAICAECTEEIIHQTNQQRRAIFNGLPSFFMKGMS